ncbi:MAG: cytochrome d ubiquinol oxidase subunit II [Devosia sp. 67-54]|uniref:cytochrome d ubiquinol oxidase subunit II n=1 Tax=unclassified Devosia TaxID=196773 RepID=UPI00095BCAA4|nr:MULTISPECIES: cytochrome d ubiquinol oxidase subunit II [unclassified Devosia]MBN9304726.1 cytochrome d ubiquinol oxidase subunit II [Devosia sp.]OJX15301.1 MAG: cytochrome d ubiquinol oxidase subunit II [Devosia sp. 67-54]
MSSIPLDYETLRLIWWALLGILLIGFAVMGGMDLGMGTLLPFVARTDEERRVVLNLSGPTWEGNQVWLVLGGGAIFAAWPAIYAASFSGFYLAMIAILLALILRPVGFKFRGKIADPRWRTAWDWALFVGGFVPSLIFGVAVGNLFLGVPYQLDDTLRASYQGNFFGLLTPFALLTGLLSLSMLTTQGATVIAARTSGDIAERARTYGRWAAAATLVIFLLGGIVTLFLLNGYQVTSVQNMAGPSNPLGKTVTIAQGAWRNNYAAMPWTIVAPVLAVLGSVIAYLALELRARMLGLFGSSLAIFGIISTAGLSLFPFLMPSSVDPTASFTVWDASSSQMTLFIMLCATVVFLPIILAYTAWVYRVMRGTVTTASLNRNPNAY